jgi:hypothetical protein
MEESDNGCPIRGQVVDRHCCDDVVSFYGIDNTCVNSIYSAPETPKTNIPVHDLSASVVFNDFLCQVPDYSDTGPPELPVPPAVDLPVICQFRL